MKYRVYWKCAFFTDIEAESAEEAREAMENETPLSTYEDTAFSSEANEVIEVNEITT